MATEKTPQSEKTQNDLLDELHPVFKVRVQAILQTLRNQDWRPKLYSQNEPRNSSGRGPQEGVPDHAELACAKHNRFGAGAAFSHDVTGRSR